MEDSKRTDTKSSTETDDTMIAQDTSSGVEPGVTNERVTPAPASMNTANEPVVTHGTSSHLVRNYVIAAGVVLLIGAGLWYVLEKQGRVDSAVFAPLGSDDEVGGITTTRSDEGTAATVNGVPISNKDVNQNISSLNSGAAAQGANPNDPNLQAQIEEQAVTMLINTELLRQAVADSDITVSDEEVEVRYQQVVTDVGGREALAARLEEVGVAEADLRADIRDEIAIQTLVEQQLSLSDITVTEEDVQTFYDEFGGEEAGLPPLDDVRMEIEAELRTQMEQELIAAYLDELRADAAIVIE